MKVKRFTGESTVEVMNKVKQELGTDAIILHTRTIEKTKFFGIIKKQEVEVIAALDEKDDIPEKKDVELNSEIKKLNDSVKYIIENIDSKGETLEEKQISRQLIKFKDRLIENGVKDYIAVDIIENIDKQINLENKDDSTIEDIIKYNIKALLGEVEPIRLSQDQKVIFFMGPTGVGKTTTIAKLASYFRLDEKKKVGLITADIYRIAAVEQLKTYADILSVPLKVIYDIKGIYESLSSFKDRDVIIIDTAGRSHKNVEQMEELKELVTTIKNKEVFLVLNIGTDIDNIKSIIDQYGFADDFKIIFTKADESEKLGNILNTKFYFKNKLSYMTTGQNVPDDISVIDLEELSKILIGAKTNGE